MYTMIATRTTGHLYLVLYWVLQVSVSCLSITTPGDVVAGRPYTLECRINRPPSNTGELTWIYIASSLILPIYVASNCTSIVMASLSPPGLSGGCHQDREDNEVYTMRIENVTEDMMRPVTWKCQYDFKEANVILDVKVMVTQVTVQNLASNLLAGTSTTFSCVTSPSKPRACIRGSIRSSGNVRELGSGDCNQNSRTVQTTTRTTVGITNRTLRFTASAEDNGAVLYCTANNSVTDPPVRSQNHTLNVQYPPRNNVNLSSAYANNTLIESGETLIFICTVGKGNPRPALNWTSECGKTSKTTRNDGSRQIRVSVNVSKTLNQKSCVCKGTQDGALTHWSQEKSRTFNVAFGPETAQLQSNSTSTGNNVTARENSTVSFTCISSESNPAAVLSWYNNSSPISAELSVVASEQGPNHGYLITQNCTVRVNRYHDGNVIRCDADRSAHTPVVSSTLTLDVTYEPLITTCKSSYILHENDTAMELSCSTWAKPEPRFTWSIQSQVLSNKTEFSPDYRQTSVLRFDKINRNNSGVYTVTVDNGLGRIQRGVNVTVYYAPDVDVVLLDGNVTTEGMSAKLECRAQGVPQNYTYPDWRHYIGDRRVPLIDSKPGKYLSISNVTFGDQGIYWCNATNGYGAIQTGLSTEINVKAKPKFPTQVSRQTAALGEHMTLVIKFVSYPAYANLTWYQLNGVSSQRLVVSDTPGSKYRQHVREVEHEFLIYGTKVLIQGHVAELDIFNVTREDFANYTLLVTNDIGRSEDVISFQLTDRPYAPTLNPVICDKEQAEVSWVSSFDGGSAQTFVIEYKKEHGKWVQWPRNISDPGEGKSVKKYISRLEQGQQYSFRVYGVNKWNTSDKVQANCTVKVVPGNPSSHLTAAIAGGVSGGVLLVAVIVIIIVLRRTKFQGKSGTAVEKYSQPLTPLNGLSDGAGGDGPFADVDDTGKGNGKVKTHSDRLMLSQGGGGAYEDVNIGSTSEVPAGLYTEVERGKKKKKSDKIPAGLYAEVTKGNRNQEVPAGLYAEVSKGKESKNQEIPAGLYAEVDKRKLPTPDAVTEGPVYSEVDKAKKQPKEKPAFSRKQKPKSKTSTPKADSSNISDEDKMGLIRSNPKNGKPPISAGTYANAAFDTNEVTYTNSGDVSVVGASGNAKEGRGRDLLYADMNFDGTKPVVHPRDITTTYASIAYGEVGPLQDEEDNEEDEKK